MVNNKLYYFHFLTPNYIIGEWTGTVVQNNNLIRKKSIILDVNTLFIPHLYNLRAFLVQLKQCHGDIAHSHNPDESQHVR